MTRRSRRYAIAFHYAADLTTFEPYQAGRTRIPVYTDGRDYFVALRSGETPPADVAHTWALAGESRGYRILRGTSAPEVTASGGAE